MCKRDLFTTFSFLVMTSFQCTVMCNTRYESMKALLGTLIYPQVRSLGKIPLSYLDDRPQEICQVGFGGVCYGLLQQHMLCLCILSHIVQLCQTSESLLRLFIHLKGEGNSLAAVDGQFVNAGLGSSCKVCPMVNQ